MQSGNIRSTAQSPPPITLPARAVAILKYGLMRVITTKLDRQLAIAISAPALLAL